MSITLILNTELKHKYHRQNQDTNITDRVLCEVNSIVQSEEHIIECSEECSYVEDGVK